MKMDIVQTAAHGDQLTHILSKINNGVRLLHHLSSLLLLCVAMESLEAMSTTQKLDQLHHFVLIPFVEPCHLLPMLNLARLLARRNVKVTLMTTPLNSVRVRANIDREIHSGSSITVQQFRSPNAEARLPEGWESLETLPSVNFLLNFVKALCMLQEPVEELFEKFSPIPTCVIFDRHLPFVADIAKKLQVPRITFDGYNCFTLLCNCSLYNNFQVYENVSKSSEPIVVPGLPHRIVFAKSRIPQWFIVNRGQDIGVLREKIREEEEEAYAVMANSFQELQDEYVKEYKSHR